MCGAGLFLIGLSYLDCTQTALAVVLLVLAVSMSGAVYSGYFVNHMDIAPQYAGTLMGISNGIGAISGFVAPYVAATVTKSVSRHYPVIGAVFRGNIWGTHPKSRRSTRGMGERLEFPSVVWGIPGRKHILAYFEGDRTLLLHIYADALSSSNSFCVIFGGCNPMLVELPFLPQRRTAPILLIISYQL